MNVCVNIKPPILAIEEKQQRNAKADATNTHPVHPSNIRHWKHKCDIKQQRHSITKYKPHTTGATKDKEESLKCPLLLIIVINIK